MPAEIVATNYPIEIDLNNFRLKDMACCNDSAWRQHVARVVELVILRKLLKASRETSMRLGPFN